LFKSKTNDVGDLLLDTETLKKDLKFVEYQQVRAREAVGIATFVRSGV
jgi:hypothetical protein